MHFSFPALEVTDDLSRLRADVRAFAQDQRKSLPYSPVSSGWMVFNRDFSRSCGAKGYIGIAWPEAYGGAGKTQIERYVVAEELLAAGAPLGAHWITDRQSGPQIIKYGTESLRRELLPRMVRGEVCFAIGMSEPDSGSDLASIRSTAAKDREGWRLNGRKIWTTNGHLADYMIGLFRTESRRESARHEGMTQFVVDLTAQGVSRRPIEDLAGGKDFSEITFDDVFVPEGNVLGKPGEGWKLAMDELAYERSGPERFLSVFPLLTQAIEREASVLSASSAAKLGRLVAHVAILREMSLSIAGQIASGNLPALEAALVKDMGNRHEREVPEVLRSFADLAPAFTGGDLRSSLAAAILAAPSFTLRGGTPEVLRGIISRGLGLR